ncbi:MAG TPA: aldehyde dehydrogenase family protein [Polyangia bacterium]|nr:aldehyde dehydrogenase family protein [Polyangia bacterium]
MSELQVAPGRLLYGGEWHEAKSGRTFESVNPSTGKPITKVAGAGRDDVDAAVAAALKAFTEGAWPKMSGDDRAKCLWRLGDLLEQNKEEVARLETLDSGKPIRDTTNVDVPYAADCFRYFAGWANKIHGETIPVKGPFLNYTRREPVGVCAGIIPWNFPLLMATWKLAPALAAGNTMIVKPASQTPLSALKLGQLALEAGFPPGVVNVLTGSGGECGMALVRHPSVHKVAFTGSTEVGRTIMKESAETLKRVSLELGGKSPNIVFADANLDGAVRGALIGIFYNMGELCTAGSRLLVEESIHDALMDKLVAGAAKMQPGDPFDPKTRVGPLVSEEHMKTVLRYIDIGKSEARLAAGGERKGNQGYFVQPTVFDGVSNQMTIAREEIFGPVLAVITFKTPEDAVRIAADTPYGLAAGVWTRDVGKAHAVAARIPAGTVWVNTYNVFDQASPFGGYKQSGFGREMGRHAIELYTETKSVWVALD